MNLWVGITAIVALGGFMNFYVYEMNGDYDRLLAEHLETRLELKKTEDLLEESREQEGLCFLDKYEAQNREEYFLEDLNRAYDELLECELGQSHEADCMSCWNDYPWAFEEEPPC